LYSVISQVHFELACYIKKHPAKNYITSPKVIGFLTFVVQSYGQQNNKFIHKQQNNKFIL